jgi:hypothetical protein
MQRRRREPGEREEDAVECYFSQIPSPLPPPPAQLMSGLGRANTLSELSQKAIPGVIQGKQWLGRSRFSTEARDIINLDHQCG